MQEEFRDKETVLYLGREIPKHGFRAFVYGPGRGPNQLRKIVNSYDEFEACLQTKMWFATQDENLNITKEESLTKKNPKKKG